MNLSIVIPVYNSVQSLRELVERCAATLPANGISEYEIVFVDDASSDSNVWLALERLARSHPEVIAIQLARNFGQQAATLCGFAHASGDYVVTMDDDLQHRPEDIPDLWKKRHEADIVIGQYSHGKQHSVWRNLCSRIKGYLDYKLIGKPRDIALSPFRLLSRQVVDGVRQQRTVYPFIPAMMFSVTQSVTTVPVTHEARKYGKSTYSVKKMFQVFSNLLINNSSFLLQLVGRCGITVAVMAFAMGSFFLFRKLFFGISASGWTSLFLITSFLGGLNLLAVSLVGEYLLRVIRTVEKKPTYAVRQAIGGPTL